MHCIYYEPPLTCTHVYMETPAIVMKRDLLAGVLEVALTFEQ